MALRMNTILEGLEILQLHVVWFFEQKGLLLNIYRSGGRSKKLGTFANRFLFLHFSIPSKSEGV